jgi:hypothetical protein
VYRQATFPPAFFSTNAVSIAPTAASERWKQEGLARGLLEGRLEGEKQGEAAFLLRPLHRRFGVLPGWATDRVRAADSVTLDEWGMRLLDAASLEDVLAGR